MWLLSRDGNGQVIEDWAIPEAGQLADAGWLERRQEANGDVSWWWTPAAETALDVNMLLQGARESVN